MNSPLPHSKTQQTSAVFALLLVLFGPLGIDLYLAAFVQMAQEFHHDMGLSLSVYLFFLGVAQLFWGWLSDRVGRRPVALIGLGFYTLASLLLLQCESFALFIAWRAVQGVGAAAIALTAFVTVRDCFEGQSAARYFALLNASLNLVPSIAPLLGSVLLAYASWRANFAFLALLSGLCLLAVWLKMPENLQQTSKSKLPPLKDFLQSKAFVAYGFACAVGLSLILTHVALSPRVLIEGCGVSPTQFALLFGSNAVLILIANLINHKLMQKIASERMLKLGLLLMTCASLLLLFLADIQSVLAYMLPIYLMSVGFAFMMGPANALALSEIKQDLGSATAWLGSFQMGTAALVSGALSAQTDRIQWGFGLAVVFLVCSTWLLIQWAHKTSSSKRNIQTF
jgi:DHA1 family bicyclomycin/chloramphenicol resistance-like MFS transporter